METSIQRLALDVEKRVGLHLEESTRNKAKEQFEEAQR